MPCYFRLLPSALSTIKYLYASWHQPNSEILYSWSYWFQCMWNKRLPMWVEEPELRTQILIPEMFILDLYKKSQLAFLSLSVLNCTFNRWLYPDSKSLINDPVYAERHPCMMVWSNLAWTISTWISTVTTIAILRIWEGLCSSSPMIFSFKLQH